MHDSTVLRSEDLAALAGPVAVALFGEPNQRLSRRSRLRFRRHGSLAVNTDTGTFRDFEADAGGGVLDLVVHAGAASTRAEAARWLKSGFGDRGHTAAPAPSPRTTAPSRATNNLDRARRIWESTKPIDGTVAAAYLDSRGVGHVARAPALRFHPALSHPSAPGRFPCLVAGVQDAHGAFLGIHRTYLDGPHKAAVEPARASLGPISGGAVRLSPVKYHRLLVGEGIETTAAAALILAWSGGAWAALSTSGLRAVEVPEHVRHVTIAADRDMKGGGQLAAAVLGERLMEEGRSASVELPPFVGDWCDVLALVRDTA